jgi:hypothetical protein
MDSNGRPIHPRRWRRATHRAADNIPRRPDPPSHGPAASTEGPPHPSVAATNDAALAAWVCASLLGLALGLGVAKYSQAWAGNALHPGAAAGTLIVVVSVALTVVAAARYAAASAGGHPSRVLATLGTVLVVMLAWIALAVISFAGWEFPPPRPR